MRLKVDENLPVEMAELLRETGHDAVTTVEQGMGGALDPDIAAVCQAESRAFVTFDADFADIRAYPPGEYAGLLVFRLRRQDKPHSLAVLRRILPLLKSGGDRRATVDRGRGAGSRSHSVAGSRL